MIIQRDEKGYGLTVSGDNPVFVQSVKESKYYLKYQPVSPNVCHSSLPRAVIFLRGNSRSELRHLTGCGLKIALTSF